MHILKFTPGKLPSNPANSSHDVATTMKYAINGAISMACLMAAGIVLAFIYVDPAGEIRTWRGLIVAELIVVFLLTIFILLRKLHHAAQAVQQYHEWWQNEVELSHALEALIYPHMKNLLYEQFQREQRTKERGGEQPTFEEWLEEWLEEHTTSFQDIYKETILNLG